MPLHAHWICTTRVDFLRFLENILWKAGDVPRFAFPVIGVLPGTLLKVLSRPAVPVQDPTPVLPDMGPLVEEQAFITQECSTEALPVPPAAPDTPGSLVFGPSCSLALPEWPPLDLEELGPCNEEPTLPSLVLDEPSPTCSPDIFWGSPDISTVPPDDSYCLTENSSVLTGKLGPYVGGPR